MIPPYEKQALPPDYKAGVFRPYKAVTLVPEPEKTPVFFKALIALLVVWISLLRINIFDTNQPLYGVENAVAERVHAYSRGEIFVNSQPPLADLVYYWLSLVTGESDDKGVTPTPVARFLPAALGIFSVGLTALILRTNRVRPIVQVFGVLLVGIENSLVTQSKLISWEAFSVFAASVAVYGVKRAQFHEAFTRKWYKSLFIAGLGLGIAISVRFSGFLTLIWVSVVSALQLWDLLGDLSVSNFTWFRHFFSRVFTLVILPLTIYLGVFYVHFISLPFNGSASGALSPAFKSSLHDSDALAKIPVEVSYGSKISIKHNNLESYLHSHPFNYKGGSQEQQVTLFNDYENDYNNAWIIESKHKTRVGELQQKFKPIKDGDTVRLFHESTGKYLRVHDLRPPISEHDYSNEVSCSGDRDLLGDINYEFKIRIVAKKDHAVNDLPFIKLRATETVFQLIHQGTRCILMSHVDKLPEKVGFGQNEVLCVDEPTIPNTLWYVEHNSHPLLDNNDEFDRVKFPPVSFFFKFYEYHQAIYRKSKEVSQKEDPLATSPETWAAVVYVTKINNAVYSIGNIPIYYFGFVLLIIGVVKHFFHQVKHLNPFKLYPVSEVKQLYYENSLESIAGWAIHYIPFFYTSGPLYSSNYSVPLFFLILLISQYVDYQISRRKYFGYLLALVIASLAVHFHLRFNPLFLGGKWDSELCETSRWFDTWTYDCGEFS